VDPKTGRLNKPKNSTYSHLIIPVQAENGHYEYMHFDVSGRRSMTRTFKFFANEQNFKAANVTNEAFNHMLAIALTSSAVSLAWLKFETTEERLEYRKKFYQPLFSKIQAMMKQNITSADFQELLSAGMNIPMSLSAKKDYIIDNNMCIGEDEWVIRKELNAVTEAELDTIISNWEKAEALGVQ
jgi:capsid protein